MGGWEKVREHIWRDEGGAPVLRHTKYVLPNGDVVFPWRYRYVGEHGARWLKKRRGESWADLGIVHPLLYPREQLAGTGRSSHLYVCEGEADVEAARTVGLAAFTAGHAGAFGPRHARLFRGWRGWVTVVRDRDLAGAAGALRAYEALLAVGVNERRVRIARGRSVREGGDLRDHLDQHGLSRSLVTENVATLRQYVARESAAFTPTTISGNAGGSGSLVRDSDGFLINPHTGFIVSGPPMPERAS